MKWKIKWSKLAKTILKHLEKEEQIWKIHTS